MLDLKSIETTLAEKLADLRFEESGHKYSVNGCEYPSVTRILADMGLTSYEWIARRYRDRGKAVHEGCRLVSTGEWDPDGTTSEIVPFIRAYKGWADTSKVYPVLVEQPIYCHSMRYAGTLDLWGTTGEKGEVTILSDIKAGKPAPGAEFQLSLYDYALSELTGVGTDILMALWLREDGTAQDCVVDSKKRRRNLQLALGAVQLWHWRNQHGLLPKNGKEV